MNMTQKKQKPKRGNATHPRRRKQKRRDSRKCWAYRRRTSRKKTTSGGHISSGKRHSRQVKIEQNAKFNPTKRARMRKSVSFVRFRFCILCEFNKRREAISEGSTSQVVFCSAGCVDDMSDIAMRRGFLVFAFQCEEYFHVLALLRMSYSCKRGEFLFVFRVVRSTF